MVWAEMVMGRNGHGPKWLWAEMTIDRFRPIHDPPSKAETSCEPSLPYITQASYYFRLSVNIRNVNNVEHM